MFRVEVGFEADILGPLIITPGKPDAIALLDPKSGKLDLESKVSICRGLSGPGSLGAETIQCSEVTSDDDNPIIREFKSVKKLDASSASRRRNLLEANDRSVNANGTEVVWVSRELEPAFDFSNSNTYDCILAPIDLGDEVSGGVVLDYTKCQFTKQEISISGEKILADEAFSVSYERLGNAKIMLPSPAQDFLVTRFSSGCNSNTILEGFSNLVVQANLIQSGCSIKADGTMSDATLTIDFGYESNAACVNGFEVILTQGMALIKRNDATIEIQIGASFRDILIKMSNCDDIVSVEETFANAASVEISGGGGNDKVYVGSSSSAFDQIIHANIVAHGNSGDSDELIIIDSASSKEKSTVLRAKKLTGLHAPIANSDVLKSIDFDGFNKLDISLPNATNNLEVKSTETDTSTIIRTSENGDKADMVEIESTDGELFLYTYGGEDDISIDNPQADLFVFSSGGEDTVTVENAEGSVFIHTGEGIGTVTVLKALGDVTITTGDELDTITIENASGNVDVNAGGGMNEILVLFAGGIVDITTGDAIDNVTVQAAYGDVNITTGDGMNTVRVENAGAALEISTGHHVDVVTVLKAQGDATITTRGEMDIVTVEEALAALHIDTGGDEDNVSVLSVQGYMYVNTGDGDDVVTVLNAGENFLIETGEDDDVISIYAFEPGNIGTIFGGGGDDILNIDGTGNHSIQENTFDGSTIRFSGGAGDDEVNTIFTSAGISNLDLFDDFGGDNFLNIECANFACYVLSRENFLANIHDTDDPNSTVERINIDRYFDDSMGEEGEWVPTARISSVFLGLNG